MAVYTNDLRLTELATGEGSGTWGTTTNTSLSLIGEAFSFGTEAITTNADTHTTTIADGSTDPGRSIYLVRLPSGQTRSASYGSLRMPPAARSQSLSSKALELRSLSPTVKSKLFILMALALAVRWSMRFKTFQFLICLLTMT